MFSLMQAPDPPLKIEKHGSQCSITYVRGPKHLKKTLISSFVITNLVAFAFAYGMFMLLNSPLNGHTLTELLVTIALISVIPANIAGVLSNRRHFKLLSFGHCLSIDPYLIQLGSHFYLPTHLLEKTVYSRASRTYNEGLMFSWQDDGESYDFLWPFYESQTTLGNGKATAQAISEAIWAYIDENKQVIQAAAQEALGADRQEIMPVHRYPGDLKTFGSEASKYPYLALPVHFHILAGGKAPATHIFIKPDHLHVPGHDFLWQKIEGFKLTRTITERRNPQSGGTILIYHDILSFDYAGESIALRKMEQCPEYAYELSWLKDVLNRQWRAKRLSQSLT